MARLSRHSLLLLPLLAFSWAGCGGDASPAATGGLPGGTMRLVSVEPVGEGGGTNLLENGDFAMWWAGAPAPERFTPPAQQFSRVGRVGGAAPGRHGIEQRWHGDDFEEEAPGLLRTTAVGLRPDATYTLEIVSRRLRPGRIGLSLHEERPGGRFAPLGESPIMEVAAPVGVAKLHRLTFRTELGGTVQIRAHGAPGAQVVWYGWAIR